MLLIGAIETILVDILKNILGGVHRWMQDYLLTIKALFGRPKK